MSVTILLLLKKNWKRLLTVILLAGLILKIGLPVIFGIVEFFVVREGIKELKSLPKQNKNRNKNLNVREWRVFIS
ncbi:hypothetical protein FACS1894176_11550 [Bacteroidia bacterium]|nr:hypothetical protein FACS1894176_11550 [Bacteroidia bacterium]